VQSKHSTNALFKTPSGFAAHQLIACSQSRHLKQCPLHSRALDTCPDVKFAQVTKPWAGRLRPDFLDRCRPVDLGGSQPGGGGNFTRSVGTINLFQVVSNRACQVTE
jgi:hypothetical protein